MPVRLACLLALLVASLLATPVAGQSLQHEHLLSELNHADFERREAATRLLMADAALSLNHVRRLYRQATTTEQRHRLLRVVEHVYTRESAEQQFPESGQGALGIVFARPNETPTAPTSDGRPAAMVLYTLPGFPAAAHLRPNDLIVSINGQSLPEHVGGNVVPDMFSAMIRNIRAGERVQLDIERDGRAMRIPLELADRNRLTRSYQQRQLPGDPRTRLVSVFRDGTRRIQHELARQRPATRRLTLPDATRDPVR